MVVDEDGCEDEAGMGRVSLWLERIDCDEVGREGGWELGAAVVALMSRYLRVLGVRGSVKLP